MSATFVDADAQSATAMNTPPECANCGADIPPGAKACPECGADERTGWRETSAYDGLDLPDTAFEESDGTPSPRHGRSRLNGIAWYWWVIAVALCVLLVRYWLL